MKWLARWYKYNFGTDSKWHGIEITDRTLKVDWKLYSQRKDVQETISRVRQCFEKVTK